MSLRGILGGMIKSLHVVGIREAMESGIEDWDWDQYKRNGSVKWNGLDVSFIIGWPERGGDLDYSVEDPGITLDSIELYDRSKFVAWLNQQGIEFTEEDLTDEGLRDFLTTMDILWQIEADIRKDSEFTGATDPEGAISHLL